MRESVRAVIELIELAAKQLSWDNTMETHHFPSTPPLYTLDVGHYALGVANTILVSKDNENKQEQLLK